VSKRKDKVTDIGEAKKKVAATFGKTSEPGGGTAMDEEFYDPEQPAVAHEGDVVDDDLDDEAPRGSVDRDEIQPPLIPMTDDELRAAGRKLATLVRELADMSADHALKRTEMKTRRDEKREEIETLAQSIRQQGR
jgi:hypothetical protein